MKTPQSHKYSPSWPSWQPRPSEKYRSRFDDKLEPEQKLFAAGEEDEWSGIEHRRPSSPMIGKMSGAKIHDCHALIYLSISYNIDKLFKIACKNPSSVHQS